VASVRNYSRDLRPAEWGSGISLHGSNPGPPMSALGGPDISHGAPNVRYLPESVHWESAAGCPLCATSGHFALRRLFDHLVGEQLHRIRDGKAERFSRLQVDDEFERGRLLDRDIGRVRAAQNLIDYLCGASAQL
jgi:hypothetical protein